MGQNHFFGSIPLVSVSAKIQRLKKRTFERALIELLRSTGVSKSKVESIEEFANRKPEDGQDYYYFTGPLDEKTRPFCRLMLSIDKVFSQEQIDYISAELNYDVLKYRGSYNCRHRWVRFRGKIISTPNPTAREIRKLINNGIQA